MNTIISSKSAKIAAGLVGVLAGVAMIATTVSAATFTTNLKQGSTGADVKNLQLVLNSDPATRVSATGAGSPGNETSYFGAATKAAVIKFQNKYASDVLTPAGLTAGTGYVGALTRAKLNTMGTTPTTTTTGCTTAFDPMTGLPCSTTTTTTTTTSGPVSVALASTNPAASAVVAGQATADLAHFAFTGNGTITTVKLVRTGISSNSTLSSVYLYNGNVRVSDGASVNNTDSTITFNNVNVAVNGTVTLRVMADIATGTAGQVIGVQLVGYTTTGNAMATVSLSGNLMNVASATLAGVTASSTSVATASINAGTMGHTFWSGAVSVSTRSVSLKGASFKFIGSAPTDAVSNLKLYVNGSAVGNAATIAADGRLSFDFGSSPVTLNTGSATLEVRGDIVKGSNRTAQFNLENSGDLMVMDTQLNVNVAVTAPSTSGFAAQNGTTVSILAGSVTTTIDTSFTALTTVTGGATGATIGKFKLQAYGEDVKVSSLAVTPTITGSTPIPNGLNNVALFWNGSQVGSSQNMAGTSTALTFQLGSALIIPAGQSGTLEVRADLQSAASANYTAGTAIVSLVAGSSNGQGQSSSATMAVPTGTLTTTGLTVSTGALSIAKAAGYTDQTVNPNTQNVKIGSYVIQNTSSSESVRFSNLAVAISGSATITNLSSLRTSETTNEVSPAASNNFSVNFTLAPGATKQIDIFANLNSVVAGNTVITTLLPTAIGNSSNVTLTPSSATTGQTITVQTGSLAVPTFTASGSSVAQFVAAGAAEGAVNGSKAQFKFVATNGTATVSELRFTVASSTGTPVKEIRVGLTGTPAPVVAGVASITGLNLSVPSGAAGTNVDVYATYSNVGNNAASSSATSTVSLTYMKYTIGGTTTSTSTISVSAPTMTSVGSKPVVTVAQPVGTVLTTGSVEAIDVTITADTAGSITLNSFPVTSTLSAGAGSPLFTAGTDGIVVKDAFGTTLTTTNTAIASAATTTATISFTNGYQIAAGTSQTFKVFMPVAALGTGTLPNTYMYTNLATGTGFSWSDTAGNSSAAVTGTTLIVNYPNTTTSSVHN